MPASVTAVVVWDTENDCATVADITVPKSSDGTSITWNRDPATVASGVSELVSERDDRAGVRDAGVQLRPVL